MNFENMVDVNRKTLTTSSPNKFPWWVYGTGNNTHWPSNNKFMITNEDNWRGIIDIKTWNRNFKSSIILSIDKQR
jgi:hypothetical protein